MRNNIVLDANIIVSAVLFTGANPRKALDKASDQGQIIVSIPVIEELRDVLHRKKFDKYLSIERRERFLTMFLSQTTIVNITDKVEVCRDPKDDNYLELAVNGNAKHLITGDENLLVLNPFKGVEILTPNEFLKI
jgi:putative PIN family toxin of toxin-antitoxin system